MTHHVEARIYVFTPEEGGRRTPFFTDYRPTFRFSDQYNDVEVTLIDKERAIGGDTATVGLSFVRPEFQRNRLFVGLQFDLTEGSRAVCCGTITKVLDESMLAAPSAR